MGTRPPSVASIPGYTYGSPDAARSPLTLDDLDRLKAAVGLTPEDEPYRQMAGEVLADQADDMVTAWRAQLAAYHRPSGCCLPALRGRAGHGTRR